MDLRFPTWFVVWHVTASVLIVFSLLGGLLWSAADFDALSYILVMSVLTLPLPLTYLFQMKSEASSA